MKTSDEVRDGLLSGLKRWRKAQIEAYDELEEAVIQGRWQDVDDLMARLSQTTAQAGLNLRRVLTKNNLLETEQL